MEQASRIAVFALGCVVLASQPGALQSAQYPNAFTPDSDYAKTLSGAFGTPTLTDTDFQATAGATMNPVAVPANLAAGNWVTIELDAATLAMIVPQQDVQLRLSFLVGTVSPGTADYVGFYSGEDSGSEPQLEVAYD